MAQQNQQSGPGRNIVSSVSEAKTDYDRIKRTRLILTGIRALFGGIGGPFLITIFAIGLATLGILFINPDVTVGGEISATPTPAEGPQPPPSVNCQTDPSVKGACEATSCGDMGKVAYPKGICPTGTHCCINFKYYCQYGGWNGGSPYCDIEGNGCGPTSIAMILSTFGDTKFTPLYTAEHVLGGQGCGYSTKYSSKGGTWILTDPIERPILNNIRNVNTGYDVAPAITRWNGQLDIGLAKRFIDNGYVLSAGADLYYASHQRLEHSGHAFNIVGVNIAAKTALAYDPTFCGYEPGYETHKRTLDVAHASTSNCPSYALSRGASASTAPGNKICKWYWVIPIKKR